MKSRSTEATVELTPRDRYNEELLANVHPADRVNPEPASRYNLVVIGAGTAGLVSAMGAAGLGARVAIVEKALLGGECLNNGCVPSKALIRSARTYADIARAERYGITLPCDPAPDFPVVMERMRRVRARISHHDSVKRLSEAGVDVFLGTAAFTGPDSIAVGEARLRFAKAIVATGSRPRSLPVEGLAEAGFLTNETVFSLTERPERLAVIGGGPLGCELAQAFARLGSRVTIIDRAGHLLVREDDDAAAILQRRLVEEGIRLTLNSRIERVEKRGTGKVITVRHDDLGEEIAVDAILLGAGRAPDVHNLDLDKADICYDDHKGISVDDHLRTTNHHVYAAGDCCLKYKFTHTADASARIAVQNALFPGHKKLSALTIPWCTYTDPEIAHTGMYAHQAKSEGIEVDTYKVPLDEVDRAIVDGEEHGFVTILTKKGSDTILGATIVAAHAGEMIGELTLAITAGVGLKTLATTIHCYPTQTEAIKHAADAYSRTRLTPAVKRWLSRWFGLKR
jgi:pyruvate/2-oxoglutarate dehydrogenase complex dihydrolipoamide dehydrogenase (E3) component